MSSVIKAIQDELLQPLMTTLENSYFEHLKANEQSKGALTANDQHLRSTAKKEIEEFKNLLIGREELELAEKGFELALGKISDLPNSDAILENLQQAGRNFTSNQKSVDEAQEPQFYETLQEMFGISKEAYDGFYQIGSEAFNHERYEEALCIFSLLTNLNNLVFEPWLGQGICWQERNNPIEALRSFSMASLVNSKHPAPYLHTAEVYLSINDRELAEQMLAFAEKMCPREELKRYEEHIRYLKQEIKEKH